MIRQISFEAGKIANSDRSTGGTTNTSYRTRTNHNDQSLLRVPDVNKVAVTHYRHQVGQAGTANLKPPKNKNKNVRTSSIHKIQV